jgi:adenosylhomocysteinase
MPTLEKFLMEKPLKGKKNSSCLYVTVEMASLVVALKVDGVDMYLCTSNPLPSQDDVAVSLVKYYNIPVFATKGEKDETYCKHINAVLDIKSSQVTMDDVAPI